MTKEHKSTLGNLYTKVLNDYKQSVCQFGYTVWWHNYKIWPYVSRGLDDSYIKQRKEDVGKEIFNINQDWIWLNIDVRTDFDNNRDVIYQWTLLIKYPWKKYDIRINLGTTSILPIFTTIDDLNWDDFKQTFTIENLKKINVKVFDFELTVVAIKQSIIEFINSIKSLVTSKVISQWVDNIDTKISYPQTLHIREKIKNSLNMSSFTFLFD